MGTALNYICATCIDKINNQQSVENYFINETDTSAPQSLVDIKINAKNFVTQRTKSFYEVYEKKKFLGNGAFGSVYKIKRINSNGREIIRALKEISKEILNQNAESAEELKNEIEVLKKLDHPNIVKIFEFYEDDKNLYIINEFCGGGDVAGLHDKYGNFPEFLLKYVMYQVFYAISFLHSNKVVHGDIKRENIAYVYINDNKDKNEIDQFFQNLFNDKEIQYELAEASGLENLSDKALNIAKELSHFQMKILDFGSAKMKKFNITEKLTGITGTSYYCSPEVIEEKYDFECDEWSCGVMMYILLTGEPPFPGNTEEEIFSNVFNTEVNLDNPKLKNVTDSCKDLIKKLLVKDPNKRLVSSDALKHEFFTSGINIGNLLKGKYKDNESILRGMLRRNLTERVKTSKFKDVVMAYISMNFSDENVEKEARQIFMEMSGGDKHFLITKESFVNKMEKICKDLTKTEIQDLFDTIDENETGNIEYEEIIRALTDKEKLLSEKNLKEAFQFFDKDNSGTISWNEIAEIVYPEGKIPQNTIKEFLDEIGQKDENMQIDFNEFKKILKHK
jgi:calcium-dependent protein kinase